MDLNSDNKKYKENNITRGPSRCLITATSSKFFPSLINMLGSLHQNYPNHPDVYIYDLGLFYTFKRELSAIPWVKILPMPHFVKHWRACYTWKTYILNTPLADLNFYIDSGCEILRSLDPIFDKIDKQDYLAVSQGHEVKMRDITPPSYFKIYDLDKKFMNSEIIAAGIFGFKRDSAISPVTQKLYDAGIRGLCLGYSSGEQWKNKGSNKNNIIPDCQIFRHDTTMISVLLYKYIPEIKIEPIENFDADRLTANPEQFLWNFRLNYSSLNFTDVKLAEKSTSRSAPFRGFNRLFIRIFLILKKINKKIKRLP